MDSSNTSAKCFDTDQETLFSSVITTYPFPIAFACQKIADEKENGGRLLATLRAYEVAIQFLGLLGLHCHYRTPGINCRPIHNLVEQLDSLQFETWLKLLKAMVSTRPDQCHLLQSLADWYDKLENKQTVSLVEVSDYQKKRRSIGHIASLQEIRNKAGLFFPLMLVEEQEKYYQYTLTLLHKLLHELSFLPKYPIYYIDHFSADKDEVVAQKLMGAETAFKKVGLRSEQRLTPGQVVIWDDERQAFGALYPFFVYQECYYCMKEDRGRPWELFMLQGKGLRRIYYNGPIHTVALREPFNSYLELQEKSQESPGGSDIQNIKEIWETAFHASEKILEEWKSIQILQNYYPRRDAESLLANFITQSTYPLCVVTGGPGSGKTMLLGQMARRWMNQGQVVLIIRIFANKGDLRRDIGQIFGGKDMWPKVQAISKAAQQQWVIILDGIEKSHKPEELFQDIKTFLQENQEWVKIIVSIQEAYYHLWQKYVPQELCLPSDGHCPMIDASRPALYLSHLASADVKEMYAAIAQSMGAMAPSLSTIPKSLRGMLRNPAVIKLFLLSIRNREIPKYLGIRDILEGFVIAHIAFSKNRREFAERLTEIMLKSRTLPLTADQILESDNTNLLKDAFHTSITSGVWELVSDAVLERYTYVQDGSSHILFHFPLSIVQDYLSYRSVALAGKHNDEMVVSYLTELSNGNYSMWGITYFALLRLLEKQYLERVVDILKKIEPFNSLLVELIYHILVLKEESTSRPFGEEGPLNSFIQMLLNVELPNIFAALAQFGFYLYREEKFKSAATLLERLSQQNGLADFAYQPAILTILAAHSYQKSQNDKAAIRLYKKGVKLLKKIEEPEKEFDTNLFLATAHRELGEMDKSGTFLDKALALKTNITKTLREAGLYEELGKNAYQHKEYDKALDYFTRQKDVLYNLGRYERMGYTLANMAELSVKHGKKAEAVAQLEEAIESFREIGDRKEAALCQHKLGKIFGDIGDLGKATEHLTSCLEVLEGLDDKEWLAETYMSLGRISQQSRKNEEALRYFYKALDIVTELGKEKDMAYCYEQFGLVELQKAKFDKAQEWFQKALTIYQRTNHTAGLGNIHYQMASLCQRRGELNDAHTYYQESLKIRKSLHDAAGMAEIYNNIALVLGQKGDFTGAFQALQECNNIYQQSDNKKGIVQAKSTEAFLYHLQGENTKALEVYQECAKLAEEIQDLYTLGIIYNRMGLIYKQRGNFYEALAYLEKGVRMQEIIEDWAGLAASYNNIGLIYDARNDYEKSLEYYGKDLKISKKMNDKLGIATSYNNIAILHYNHKNYARALWYFEKSVPIYEELQDKEMLQRVQERIQHVRDKL